jgi:hypothetical protein
MNVFLQAMARRRLALREQELAIATDRPAVEAEEDVQHQETLVRSAMGSAHHWLLNHTMTFNEHWADEGFESPEEPFPDFEYLPLVMQLLEAQEKVVCLEKSRDLMASWMCVGYFTFMAQKRPRTQCVFQSQQKEKAFQLIDYAKQLWRSQPKFLRDAYPLTKDVDAFSESEMIYAHGSQLFAIPGGKDGLRSYHPWGYMSDEAGFQPEAGGAYATALAGCNKIILNSTANASWYADFRNDAY